MTARKSITDNGLIIFKDQLPLIKMMKPKEIGEGVKLLLEHFDDMEAQNNMFYELIASNVRRYRKQSEVSSSYGKLGGNPTLKGRDKGGLTQPLTAPLSNNTIQEKKIQNNTRKNNNIIPSLQEVIDYCNERNNYVDPQEWFDYYSANGWKIGKNPMKDWKACVRYWERKKQPTQTKSKAQLIEEHNLKHIEELFKGDNLC